MAVVELDFTGAPPAQGGGTDRIPAGRYNLKVTAIKDGASSNQNRMFTVDLEVASGNEQGKQLRDNFVVAPGANGSKFGLQKFHAFLVALGAPLAQGKVKFDTDKLVGRVCEAQVGDAELRANGENEARTVSQPRGYYPLGTTSAAAKAQAAPAAPPAAAPKAAAPKAAAPVAKKAAAPPPPVVVEEEAEEEETELELDDTATDISDEVDDLFA